MNARDVKNVPGRPKTDKLDAVWLAKLAERGMVRASFVPPKAVRQLRDFTRTRTVFVQERTRHKHRVDKALQDAQIKLSDAVSDLFGRSGRAMLDALVAGERNPRALAELAQGSLVKNKAALAEALTGQFEDHHARLLGVLLSTVDHLTGQIRELDRLIAQTLEEISTPDDGPGTEPSCAVSARVLAEKLDAVPGIGPATAQIILAEIGADMSRFPTPEHLVSWAKLCPRTIQSGAKNTAGPAGQGNPWLKGALGEAANAAARTNHFPRGPLPAHRQTSRPRQSTRRRRPLATRHHLAPDQRPGRLLPGTRRRLAPAPPQPRPQDPRSRPPAPGPRPPGRPHTDISLTARPNDIRSASGPELPPALPKIDFPISIKETR